MEFFCRVMGNYFLGLRFYFVAAVFEHVFIETCKLQIIHEANRFMISLGKFIGLALHVAKSVGFRNPLLELFRSFASHVRGFFECFLFCYLYVI